MANERILIMDEGTMTEAELAGRGLVLVDFWASWCGPCRRIAPILEELAEELDGKLTIGKLNVDEHPKVAERFRVMSIPTLILFQGGAEVDRIIGLRGKPELAAAIEARL